MKPTANADASSADFRCPRCGTPLLSAEQGRACPRCISTILFADPEPRAIRPVVPQPAPLRQLGDYELLAEIARGGMGIVYRARQRGLNRQVAVKLMRDSALARPEDVKRFRAEAASAAKLRHPHIIAIYDVGEEGGQHYFAMDLVEGVNLADRTREGPLPAREAAELVAQIADAVQHAHEQGVLHRDLKPSNVLVDAAGKAYVTDFGLARPLDADSSLTVTGQVLGTPGYMPPEQATGKGTVGPAADIYSLGALLYHLITGRAPFAAANVGETLRQVIEQEPVSPQLLNPAVPRDLTSVCLKCLAKRPLERYASASALGEDLRRFLRGEPTLARPAGQTERLVRWARRKPALATAFACVGLVAIVGFVGITWQWRRAEQHAAAEERQRELSEKNELAARQSLYAADMNLVQQSLAKQNLSGARELLNPHGAGEPDLRGWEWYYFSKLCRGDEAILLGDVRPAWTLDQLPSLISLAHLDVAALVLPEGGVELWDVRAEKLAAKLEKRITGEMLWMCADASDSLLVTSATDGFVRVWDLTDIASPLLTHTLKSNRAVSISARRKFLATAPVRVAQLDIPDNDTVSVTLWDYERGKEIVTLPESGDNSVFARDGRTLVTGSWKGSAKIWNTEDWSLRHTLSKTGNILAMAMSPDDRLLVTCSWEGPVQLWDVHDGRLLGSFEGHSSRVWTVQFSPDGRVLATASGDQTIALWDVATRQEVRRLHGHDAEVRGLAFSADGSRLASTDINNSVVRVWKTKTDRATNAPIPMFSIPLFSPDGKTLATAGQTNANLWDVTTRQLKVALPAEPNPVGFSADGRMLITATVATGLPLFPNTIVGLKHWDVATAALKRTINFEGTNEVAGAVALSPDSRVLAVGDLVGNVVLRDADTGTVRERLPGASPRVWNLVFSRDGRMLAVGSDLSVRLWYLGPGQKHFDFGANGSPVAISPDGQTLAVASYREIQLYDTTTGNLQRTLRGHREGIYWLAFSPDGRTLASAVEDIKLWNVPTGREVASFQQEAPFLFVNFSPDGANLIGGRMGEAYLWTAATEEELFRPSVERRNILRSQIQKRSPEAATKLLDLSSYYNAALTESWHPGNQRSELGELPSGLQSFAGVLFDVRGLIQVGHRTRSGERYPPRVSGIAVGSPSQRLHFLHSAVMAFSTKPGAQIGSYVVRFANGQSREVPIRIGVEVADWFSQPDEGDAQFTIAWTGSNEASRAMGRSIRLFKTTWPNPLPGEVIESIDFAWAGTEAAPFLVAITAE